MKIEVDRKDFLVALNKVQNVVSAKSPLPILGNVLLEAKGDEIKLTTTDLDMGISCNLKAIVKKAGETTIPVKNLTSIIRELPEGNVNLEINDKNVMEIRAGTIYFKLLGLPAEEFPTFLEIEEKSKIDLQGDIFHEALHLTSYAMSRDPMRYVLNGLLFDFEGENLTLVSTDSKRLATYQIDIKNIFKERLSIIVPSKTINELNRLMDDSSSTEMLIDDGKVAFRFDDTIIISKIIDNKFPNYKNAVPAKSKNRIIFDKEAILSAIRRVSLISFNEVSTIRVTLKKGEIEFLSNNPEIGAAKESLPIKYDGEDFDIIYNSAFLMEPLKNINEDEVFLEIYGGKNECVIQNSTPFMYILMPMTLE